MGMTPELQKYYEDRRAMMTSQGWADLMQDMQDMLTSVNTLDGVKDDSTLFFRQGEVSILRWILGIQEASEKAYEELTNENP